MERPVARLAGFRGVLQVDGYAGYNALAARGEVQPAFCWSHVRRPFYTLAGALGVTVRRRPRGAAL